MTGIPSPDVTKAYQSAFEHGACFCFTARAQLYKGASTTGIPSPDVTKTDPTAYDNKAKKRVLCFC